MSVEFDPFGDENLVAALALEEKYGIEAFFAQGSMDYANIQWKIDNPPTQSQYKEIVREFKDSHKRSQYKRDRLSNYPSTGDFLDAYYWAQKGDNTKMDEWVANCDKVKSDYPKPS
jgi:hypothetical protein